MVKLFTRLLILAVVCFATLSAQITKEYLDPYPTGENIQDIAILDTSTIVVAANNGLILRTTNNGQTWSNPNSGVSTGFYTLRFATKTKGFAGTPMGLIQTTDAGVTWSKVTLSQTFTVTSVYFMNPDTGWIGGGAGMTPVLMMTTDGGTNWNTVTTGATQPVMSIFFLNKDYGWLGMYDGKVRYTTNGGTSWNDVATGITGSISKIQFTSLTKGWCSGGSYGEKFYKTTNGGTTWGPVALPSSGITYSSWNFVDSMRGVVAGQNAIYRTWNGGTTWSSASAGLSNAFFTILRYGADTLRTWGYFGYALVRSADNGKTWLTMSKSSLVNSMCVHFANKDTGWVTEGSGIKKTTDGGKTWTTTDKGYYFYEPLYFLNSSIGWTTGSQSIVIGGGARQSPVLRTTDGGANWVQSLLATGLPMQGICFADQNNGWVVGDSGRVFHSTDGGVNWTPQTSNTGKDFYAVTFVNATTGWISADGFILKTTNGGTDWTTQLSVPQLSVHSIHMFDADTGWACGEAGAVYKTTNGGTNWKTSSAGYNRLKTIKFIGAKYGYVAGENGAFYYTTDGGSTWIQNGGFGDAKSMSFISSSIGFVIGNGLVKITNSAAVTSVEKNSEAIPSAFSLSQNYPNPFNPSTNINFKVPANGFVTLKIYDVLGREVTTLVNEQMNSGSYKVSFDGKSFSSGMYFYQLKFGNSIETKKMTLLK